MKKDSSDDTINVNRRKGDKVLFESTFIQQIYDGIDFLREESQEILKEIDSNVLNDFDLKEFGEETMDQIDDIMDDMSKFRSEVISPDDLPEFVRDSSKDMKRALNRDQEYLKRAKRKLERIDSDYTFLKSQKTNIRVVELCDKAIDVNYDNYEPYYIKGIALTNLKKYDDAIKEFVKSLALNEENTDAWLAIANAYMLDGDYSEAIEVYDSVLLKDEKSFEALKGKAVCYYKLDELEKAGEEFKKANDAGSLDEDCLKMWKSC